MLLLAWARAPHPHPTGLSRTLPGRVWAADSSRGVQPRRPTSPPSAGRPSTPSARGCRARVPAPSRAPPSGPHGGDTPRHTPAAAASAAVPAPGAPPPSSSRASPVRLSSSAPRSAPVFSRVLCHLSAQRGPLFPCSPTILDAAPVPDWPTPSVPDSPFYSSRPSSADARERLLLQGLLPHWGIAGESKQKGVV